MDEYVRMLNNNLGLDILSDPDEGGEAGNTSIGRDVAGDNTADSPKASSNVIAKWKLLIIALVVAFADRPRRKRSSRPNLVFERFSPRVCEWID